MSNACTSNPSPNRPPDINLEKEGVPAGTVFIEGKMIHNTLRSNSIQFGKVFKRELQGKDPKLTNVAVGVIIREEDVDKWNDAVAKRDAKKAYVKKQTPQRKFTKHEIDK